MSDHKEMPSAGKKKGIVRRFLGWWCKPSRWALGALLTFGFVGGIGAVLAFNTTMHAVGTDEFCTSCHEMRDNVFQEYMQSSHYSNRVGQRVGCSDCHVPQEFFPMMVRKIQATKELYGHYVTGIIDTPEKFNEHRLAMAQTEWARLKANDSQECRNCHQFDYMDLMEQKTVAAQFHTSAVDDGKTCIDCHKGVAHQLPDMTGIDMGF